MSNPIAMGAQLAASAARFTWFYGINRMLERDTRRLGRHAAYQPQRPVPARQELMVELANLFLADAEAVRAGLYPPLAAEHTSLIDHLGRVRGMFADLPAALARRASADAASVKSEPGVNAVPAYYAQDFHFQSGGYLSERSARLYDVQVETLFYGAADAMRRAALGPIAKEMSGRDQRRLSLLDVACGTGRFLRQVRLAWPALDLSGLDLSPTYLAEAERHVAPLRPVRWLQGNAEAIPVLDASQDIVTCIFLFHELPGEVRRAVAAEMARVLKPGGLFVFIDSQQMGDRPGWDGLLEAFPERFHEPYFRHYASDDLDEVFGKTGLAAEGQNLAFLSKVMVRRRVR
jgi:ubiquinone/menaquinone biosynthesis C-methylase UbiE